MLAVLETLPRQYKSGCQGGSLLVCVGRRHAVRGFHTVDKLGNGFVSQVSLLWPHVAGARLCFCFQIVTLKESKLAMQYNLTVGYLFRTLALSIPSY